MGFYPWFHSTFKKKNLDKKENEKEYELILINRENKSLGLRSIGEIMSYNRICNPMYSFLISDKGHSNEISYFMINETFRNKLIRYNEQSLIAFFKTISRFSNTSLLELNCNLSLSSIVSL